MADYKQCADKAQTGPGLKPATSAPAAKIVRVGVPSYKPVIQPDTKAVKG